MNVEAILEASFKNGIRKFLIENRREFDGRIHVSHVVQCLRRSYFEILNPPETEPNFNLFIGVSMHVMIEEILAKELQSFSGMIRNTYHELELNDSILVGTADFIIDFGDEAVIVDLKTTKYDLPFAKNKFAERMFEKHRDQLVTYLHLAERQFNVSYGILMYIKRQNGSVRFFRVVKDRELYDRMVKRAKKLKKALKRGEPPEGEPDCFCKPFVDPKTREERGGCPFYYNCPYALRLGNDDLETFVR